MNKKLPPIHKKTLAISLVVFLLLAPIVCAALLNFKYKGTAFPRLSLNDKSYTGLSYADAKTLFEGDIAYRYKDGMKFTYKDKRYTVSLAELGYEIDAGESVGQVFSYGHKQDILRSIQEQLSLLAAPVTFQNRLKSKDFLIEENRWKEFSALETPAQNFSYKFDNGNFVPVAAEEGFVINQEKLRKDIESNLSNFKNDEISVELKDDKPVINEDKGQSALLKAKNLLTKEIVLKYNSSTWKVAAEDFGEWIDFAAEDGGKVLAPAPASDKIKDYLVSIVPQVNREPVNAQLEFKESKVEVFSLSQEGIELDTDESAKKIGEEIFQEQNYSLTKINDSADTAAATAAIADPITIELVVSKVAPELTTDNIDNMGITSLLATGESNFKGSSKSRVHNVTVGAAKFNGALIGPGDTFSFNTILGDVGPKEGYLPELVIKQGKTIPEYGGGLCQVSTTAFRAAVSAGLEVTERKNHAYAVSYYSPQGTDATIYPPHPDLAFVNNTPNYILIQTRIAGTILDFDFYGTSDGRKVETEGPVVYERGTGGAMKTWWKQKVYDKDGKLFLDKTFYSNYKPASLYPHTNPLE